MAVVILFGSETGTSEAVADNIADVLARQHDCTVYDMLDFDIADLDADDFHVIVCSTYGDGELPTGATPFFDDLSAARPDLTGLRFAVFGLGDSVYEQSFNRAGDIAATKLIELGAVQIGEHARHDGSTTIRPRDMAQEWAASIAGLLADQSVKSVSV